MFSFEANPKLDRQLVPDGPIVLWRDGEGGRRVGLLIVPRPCPFPECPDRHVDLELYPLDDSVSEVNVGALEVWTIDRRDAIVELQPAFTASLELDDEQLGVEPDATPELVAWLQHELPGALLAVLREQFQRARARAEALARAIRPHRPQRTPGEE